MAGESAAREDAARKGVGAAGKDAARKGAGKPSFLSFDMDTLDAHCHLHHDPFFYAFAQENPRWHFFCMSEVPDEFQAFSNGNAQACELPQNAILGLGLHPWKVAESAELARAQAHSVIQLLSSTWLVGEIGLDFSSSYEHTRENQLFAFREIAGACAHAGNKVLSIHAVKAAGQALDILEETRCLDSCTCIFHWFSGTGDELIRARNAGCYFSFGLRALRTKRGRAYATQLPPNRVLHESDVFAISELQG